MKQITEKDIYSQYMLKQGTASPSWDSGRTNFFFFNILHVSEWPQKSHKYWFVGSG